MPVRMRSAAVEHPRHIDLQFEPYFVAVARKDGVRFRVWAPRAARVDLVVEESDRVVVHRMERESSGVFAAHVSDAGHGTRYRYRPDTRDALPDPASRFQPDGVHGSSMVVDPCR